MFLWIQFGNITQKISSEYAQFHTDKLVGDLGSYINREIGLAISVSKNSSIVEWMKSEGDSQRKEVAFHELQSFLQVFHDKNGFIAFEGSKKVYYLNGRSGKPDIEAEGTLNQNNAEDGWYFHTLQQTEPYNINISYDRLLHITRVWINVKVQEDGRNIGVFGTGIFIDSILQNIFSKYRHDGVKSVIINEEGRIVLDSDYANASLGSASPISGSDLNSTLFQYSDDPQLVNQFKDYLASHGKPTVIRLNNNHYQYAAIAPILDSNWHVATFFQK